jgi:hypothetical protein
MRKSEDDVCQFLFRRLKALQAQEVDAGMNANRKMILDLLPSLLQNFSLPHDSLSEIILSLASMDLLNPRNKRKEDKRRIVESTLLAEVIKKPQNVSQVTQLVKEKFSAEVVLESAIMTHSVGGEFASDSVNDFANALSSLDPNFSYEWTILSLLPILESLRNVRKNAGMAWYSSLTANQRSYDPLIPRIVEDILLRREDQNDVKYIANESTERSGGFGSLLGSSWGWSSCPRPSDHETIILYVIGGVTCDELRRISDLAKDYTHLDVLVGSDRIITRRRVLKELFPSKF